MSPITPEWLRKIADEIEKDSTRWINDGAMARCDGGYPIKPDSSRAKCWCINGFARRDGVAIETFMGFWSLVATNDSLKTPAEFIAWLREMAAEMGVQA